jgi:hypothetical protein
VTFTRIDVDQATEHLNKYTKGQGGISEITLYPKTCSNSALPLLSWSTSPQRHNAS